MNVLNVMATHPISLKTTNVYLMVAQAEKSGCKIWEPWMSVHIFMAFHPIVELCQSGPKSDGWSKKTTNIAASMAKNPSCEPRIFVWRMEDLYSGFHPSCGHILSCSAYQVITWNTNGVNVLQRFKNTEKNIEFAGQSALIMYTHWFTGINIEHS